MGKSVSLCVLICVTQALWFYPFIINTNNLYIWKYIILSLVYF